MRSTVQPSTNLSVDILASIFDHLAGDYNTLFSIGLTCRGWRCLSLPSLLRIVDLSCHNNGRLPEHECEIRPVVYADYDATFRPQNLVTRQRAFLHLIMNRPGLAKYVKSLTWTLIWKDFEDAGLTEIDRQTWSVFSRMSNVRKLDLGSLHEIHSDELVRQNPSNLFPAVNDLRLLGWMHRGLVEAIVTSIDVSKLRSLKLDCLQEEGALPNGAPMSFDINEQYAPKLSEAEGMEVVDAKLYHLQKTGNACIWPGPMWMPLRLLSAGFLDSLSRLEVKVVPVDWQLDPRNYDSVFQDTVKLILKVKASLETLVICMGQRPSIYEEFLDRPNQCGTWRNRMRSWYRPLCITMTASFLNQCLEILNNNEFPKLECINFTGFDILHTAWPYAVGAPGLSNTYQAIRGCPFANASFPETRNLDDRNVFQGYDYGPDMEGFNTALLMNS